MEILLDPETEGAIELLSIFQALEARGLITVEVNDLGELRVSPTPAGIAAVREEEARRGE